MPDSVAWIGWLSSFVLLVTIAIQIRKQWKSNTSEGISIWLFAGQVASECGFVVYSWRLSNWVFVTTNALLLLENIVGFALVIRHRKRAGKKALSLD